MGNPAKSYAPQQPVEPPYAGAGVSLPDGWAAYQDAEGRTYYANAVTQQTSWEHPVAASAAADAANDHSCVPQWSTEYTYTLGGHGDESTFEGRALLLDTAAYTSVVTTVDLLNRGAITIEAGFCVMFSNSKQKYFLLW